MIATMPARSPIELVASAPERGASDQAQWIARSIQEVWESWTERTATYGRALSELEAWRTIAERCNWDGEGGAALQRGSYLQARSFLNALGLAPAPEISVDPDGEVAFDWFFGSGRRLAAGIQADGRIQFAMLDGARSYRGTDRYRQGTEMPELLLQQLSSLARRRG